MAYTSEDRDRDKETVALFDRMKNDVKADYPAISLYYRIMSAAIDAQSRLAKKA